MTGRNGTLRRLPPKEHTELLIKNWMTHDAMWFYHCAQECGMEKTNRINRAAVLSMAQIEIKRAAKALGAGNITTFPDLKELIEGAWDLLKADFMDFTVGFPSDRIIHVEMRQCFAYEGVKKIGVADQYECGIMDRIEGWFEGLGLRYAATPQVEGCMMHREGRCFRDFTIDFA